MLGSHFRYFLTLCFGLNGENRRQNHMVPTFVHLLSAHNDNFDIIREIYCICHILYTSNDKIKKKQEIIF